jgi:heme/copper-type cytochrome/quinol oxidase subunit 2
MQARRMILGGALVVGLFVVFAGIGLYEASIHHGTGPTAVTIEVSVRGSSMTPSTITAREGDQVVLSITSDRNQSLSIPSYGLTYQLTPAAPVAATFIAGKAGTFDIVIGSSSTGAKVGVLKVT